MPVLKVGIIGAGEVAQVIHLPTLTLLSHLYQINGICDISLPTAQHCSHKFHIPYATTDPYKIINDTNVDVVFVLTSDEFHAEYTIAALRAGKNVMVEKPLTISIPAAERIIDAEKKSRGRVFVGYMRRYAPSFTGSFLREVASIPRILYARVRDMSGPNAFFVNQSGTFQVKPDVKDIPAEASQARDKLLDGLYREAFPNASVITDEMKKYCRFLGSLGSHDLSLMREALGGSTPSSIEGVSVNDPFYSAIFTFSPPPPTTTTTTMTPEQAGRSFSVTYESGIDTIPSFDAHLAIYGTNKRVSIQYDSPYVKGLPIKVHVEEVNEYDEKQVREVLSSYEDAYTAELTEMYTCFVNGKEIKTSAEDALEDLRLYDAMYRKAGISSMIRA
ncbi:NAD binding Rossmann fold oxidoreductase, putative [Talaromyces stipitatus ATCC 10500]|uniref:NAD binding Rossmann fold oxidoreductase, putative n=1 Tax=Talaromyces stipitatus (strain ATCC 10500 / CBS 375.48 / QM 6759 / NRRL 1006) TaxID=441959 RepID=B8MDT4_TALSN|nr:NAD binding Rossmann fold oxidoreductase, putative [Talaromyces stipitatus ATCC 10500]EED18313.1 NAD binding Rossmann fold oxidoreductase, putative [Talaromyces stipitatus ATCC 10500]